jgi:hypothetical protein
MDEYQAKKISQPTSNGRVCRTGKLRYLQVFITILEPGTDNDQGRRKRRGEGSEKDRRVENEGRQMRMKLVLRLTGSPCRIWKAAALAVFADPPTLS